MKAFRLETSADLERMQLLALVLFLVLFFTAAAVTPSNSLLSGENAEMVSAAVTALPLIDSATSK